MYHRRGAVGKGRPFLRLHRYTDSQQRKSVSMLWAMNRTLLRTFIILILKREQN